MHKFNKITLAVSLLCGVVSSSMAQRAPENYDYNPSWYVAPSLGVLDADTHYGVTGHGEAAAIRFGKAFSQDWDLQFGTSYGRQRTNGTRYQQNTLGADALYMFSRKSFRPFVLIGGGVEYDKVNINAQALQRDANSAYLNAGVGFQYGFSDQWAMQADLRRVHGFVHGNDFNFSNSNNNYLNVGLVYTFDKPVQRVARVEPAPVAAPLVITETMPQPPAPPAPPPVRFEKVTLSATELFGFDSAKLGMPQQKLDEIANVLNNNTQINDVVISGYTDRIGTTKYNMKLSQRRAEVVKAYLIDKGVAATRLTAQGKGETNPVVQCTEKNKAALITCLEQNRRVEVEQITVERRVQ
ncbi:OmpA family protein [Undibacterium sp. RTI2.1]|uniref:OmpA family protein n=1 Tax=unclassified Undibacterium TaxID=2630295 RepID=UPI002B23CBDA|nr:MULTISPECIES: OmpA family protein [unclassified Undibacterium]MEB0031229.1 OmpA family protein [Undibacterium sp. RTI2.1]MEB0117609.1 OmpA family protein [Undibacterium sp. RTI2.2]